MRNHALTLKDGRSNLTVNLNEKLREWKDRGMESLPEFDEVIGRKNGALKAFTDATAAYLVVKVIRKYSFTIIPTHILVDRPRRHCV